MYATRAKKWQYTLQRQAIYNNTMQKAHYFFRLLLLASSHQALASITTGKVVQFIVYAERQADVIKVFPGAHVDHSWNNLFIVTIWTNDPETLITDIQKELDTNTATLQTIIPPFQIEAATQKWVEYNLVWIVLLLLVFLTGCACGGAAVAKCKTIKKELAKPYQPCPTIF